MMDAGSLRLVEHNVAHKAHKTSLIRDRFNRRQTVRVRVAQEDLRVPLHLLVEVPLLQVVYQRNVIVHKPVLGS